MMHHNRKLLVVIGLFVLAHSLRAMEEKEDGSRNPRLESQLQSSKQKTEAKKGIPSLKLLIASNCSENFLTIYPELDVRQELKSWDYTDYDSKKVSEEIVAKFNQAKLIEELHQYIFCISFRQCGGESFMLFQRKVSSSAWMKNVLINESIRLSKLRYLILNKARDATTKDGLCSVQQEWNEFKAQYLFGPSKDDDLIERRLCNKQWDLSFRGKIRRWSYPLIGMSISSAMGIATGIGAYCGFMHMATMRSNEVPHISFSGLMVLGGFIIGTSIAKNIIAIKIISNVAGIHHEDYGAKRGYDSDYYWGKDGMPVWIDYHRCVPYWSTMVFSMVFLHALDKK